MSDENQAPEVRAPAIRIPSSAHKPLKAIAQLPESDFEKLLMAFSEVGPKLSPVTFSDSICRMVPSADQDVIQSIVRELFRMNNGRSQSDGSAERAATLIADAAKKVKSTDFKLNPQEIELLRDRLSSLFNSHKALSLTAKTIDLLTEHQHVYYTARIFSDMRPIFTDDASSIEAAVIIHNLAIHYGEGEAHKDFHIALDEADIQSLKEVLDRAETKAAVLRNSIKASGVSYLSFEE